MIYYLLAWTFLLPGALTRARRLSGSALFFIASFLIILIGFRHDVGCDWPAYLRTVLESYQAPWVFSPTAESGYSLLNWIGANWFGGVYLVNLVCAVLFVVGLLNFCRAQPRSGVALILSFPYLVTVVGMGYTRQSVAVSLSMMAILALQENHLLKFLAWISFASTFHRSALVLLVLPAATISRSLRFATLFRLLLLSGAGIGLYYSVLAPSLEQYTSGYLESGYQSQGALIRLLLSFLPGILFLYKPRAFDLTPDVRKIWFLMSLMSVLSAIAFFTVASSTAVDRIALYLLPLQLFVGSRLPDTRLFGIPPGTWKQLLIFLSFSVLIVWLNFATHAFCWLPYRNILFSI